MVNYNNLSEWRKKSDLPFLQFSFAVKDEVQSLFILTLSLWLKLSSLQLLFSLLILLLLEGGLSKDEEGKGFMVLVWEEPFDEAGKDDEEEEEEDEDDDDDDDDELVIMTNLESKVFISSTGFDFIEVDERDK